LGVTTLCLATPPVFGRRCDGATRGRPPSPGEGGADHGLRSLVRPTKDKDPYLGRVWGLRRRVVWRARPGHDTQPAGMCGLTNRFVVCLR
jgi:hypothetical protein